MCVTKWIQAKRRSSSYLGYCLLQWLVEFNIFFPFLPRGNGTEVFFLTLKWNLPHTHKPHTN